MTVPPGIGAGPLSPAARARLARAGSSHLPVALPDLTDPVAVGRWRAEVHRAWGEDDDPAWPHRSVRIAGVACRVAGDERSPALVYVHGGGHCLGSAAVAIPITARLVAGGLHVVSVDHRLAPEHPFPAAIDDVVAVAIAVARHGPFALGGDSAGGGVAVAAALELIARRLPGAAALVLLSPLVDHEPDLLDPMSLAYLNGAGPDDPRASPLHADLTGLPPVLLQVGGERLLAQATRFARRARAVGVDVTLDVWDGLWHAWHYHRELPEADLALAEAAAHARRHLTLADVSVSLAPSAHPRHERAPEEVRT